LNNLRVRSRADSRSFRRDEQRGLTDRRVSSKCT